MPKKKNLPLNPVVLIVILFVMAAGLAMFNALIVMVVAAVPDVPVAISYLILFAFGVAVLYYLSKHDKLGLET